MSASSATLRKDFYAGLVDRPVAVCLYAAVSDGGHYGGDHLLGGGQLPDCATVGSAGGCHQPFSAAGVGHCLFAGGQYFLGAFIAGVISTVIIAWIHTRSPIKEDAAMGIVFSAFFALGITLITAIQKDNKIDLNHFLFGNILGVTTGEVRDTAIIAVVVLLTVVLLYKELCSTALTPWVPRPVACLWVYSTLG
jgi:hypothetical protein